MSTTKEQAPAATQDLERHAHGEAAAQHAEAAKEKAAEAGAAAADSAKDAGQATKEKLSQTVEAVQTGAVAAKDSTAEALGAASHYPAETARAAADRASHAAAEAKEKLSEAGEAVHAGVHSTVEFIKQHVHLPRVMHEELTVEERQSRALLDEAMGRSPEDLPKGIDELSLEERRPSATPTQEEHVVAAANRATARGLVERANAAVEGAGRTADAALSATPEIRARMEERRAREEEVSAETPLQALAGKVEGAAEYVK